MNEIQIIAKASNVFIVRNGEIEIEIHCSDDHISIKDMNKLGIEYPEKGFGLEFKDRVRIGKYIEAHKGEEQ